MLAADLAPVHDRGVGTMSEIVNPQVAILLIA